MKRYIIIIREELEKGLIESTKIMDEAEVRQFLAENEHHACDVFEVKSVPANVQRVVTL